MSTPSLPGSADAIRLRPDAFERMAKAAKAAGADVGPGRKGRPNASGLLGGKRTGTPNVMYNTPNYAPSKEMLALMARRHATWRGISWHAALGELCFLGPADNDAGQQVAPEAVAA